jgi:hypothetical protein
VSNSRQHDGTCAWCLGGFVVEGKRPVRHGWKEQGGFRRIGQYGNVYHSGGCPGDRYPAYQISCEGTKAHLEVVEREIKQLTEILAELATRPTLTDYGKVSCGHDRRTYQTIYAHYGFRISDGESFTIVPDSQKPWDKDEYDYERVWLKHHHHYSSEKRHAEHRAATLREAIKIWEPKEMAPRKPKGPTVHYVTKGYKGRDYIWCGSNAYFSASALTSNPEETTCSRCLRALEKDAAEKAQLQAEKADAKTLAAWLRENGPAPAKKMKAALGWDQKRLNKAKDRSHNDNEYGDPGYIHTDSSKPAKWYVRRSA